MRSMHAQWSMPCLACDYRGVKLITHYCTYPIFHLVLLSQTPILSQWCEDRLAALPHSRGVHPMYDDFSTPCYDGEHQVIMGGSFVSTGDEASVFARFHFRPHFFQHAGFRVVSSSGRSWDLKTSWQHVLAYMTRPSDSLRLPVSSNVSTTDKHAKRSSPSFTSCTDHPVAACGLFCTHWMVVCTHRPQAHC